MHIAINQICSHDQDTHTHSLTFKYSFVCLQKLARQAVQATRWQTILGWFGFSTSYHPQTAEGDLSSLLEVPS